MGILRKIFSLPGVMVCGLMTFVCYFLPLDMADPDIWWHLRDAEWQWAHKAFLREDLFSFTARGAGWMNHEWLGEVPFYLGWRWHGMEGVYVVTLLAIEAILLAVMWLAWRRSQSWVAAVGCAGVACVLSTVSFGPRTLLFGWICLLLELVVLEFFAEGRKCLWVLPLLFGVWVNVHGSWLIGLVVFAVFVGCGGVKIEVGDLCGRGWTGSEWKRLIGAGIGCFGALFANPYGWRLVVYPFDLAFRQKLNVANVEEWKSLDFHSPRGRIFLITLGLMAVAQVVKRRKWTPIEVGLMGVAIYSSFAYSRFLFLAGILAMPLMANSFAWVGARRRRERWVLNAALVGVFVVLAVVRLRGSADKASMSDLRFPNEAVGYLRGFAPKGNVFNEFLWGGWVDWHARQVPVFVDSRVDIFEYNGAFGDYLDASRLKDTDAVLAKYKIRYVFYERESPLVYYLRRQGGWRVDYEDRTAVMLERVQ